MKRSSSYQDKLPLLYLIATPIGNLKELSPRAIETIQEADYVAAEDTRNTAKLLSFYNIKKSLISLHEHNESTTSNQIVELLKNGKKIVYVSDAGFPAISDPGSILVNKCLDNDINVSVIAGSNALLTALVGSGLNTDHFYFHGFLNAKNSERNKELAELVNRPETLIFYEAPHRIDETLASMQKSFGNRKAVIARELTKMYEEYIRGTLDELATIDKSTLKGEMVVLIEGKQKETREVSDELIIEEYLKNKSKSISDKELSSLISVKLDISKRRVYNLIIKNKD
ncbi:MAG: 16S rRNA (cytidine(1402)-2'-O)-methyltransferase [Erysipelotrichaceae bacterium]|nr:16S rRNA (cytidine(1402)-2'-O)-methyltransferase [Erysipelotrichaceae bacterium]